MSSHRLGLKRFLASACIASMPLLAFVMPGFAAEPPPRVLSGQEAFGDWRTDAPGVRRRITVTDLPKPFTTASVDNGPKLVPRPRDAWPKVPVGFKVDLLVAEGLSNPRKIITAPNGDLLIAESTPGRIRLLRLGPDGGVEKNVIFAEGLQQPFGIAFPPGPEPAHVYVANTGSVVRFAYRNGDLKARGKPEMLVADIPSGGRLRGGGHWTRDIVFTPDGKKMFVSVGSHSNNDDNAGEKNRAAVLQYNPDGSGFRLFASGIRNPVGLAIEPITGQLWASVNERDGLGDNLPPDYITHVREGGFYGWPWFYMGGQLDPKYADRTHPQRADQVIIPDVLLQAHSASLCMTFYSAEQFPAEYRGDAFAAEHGSWNRSRRTGYKVVRVPMKDGKATGEYEDFLTGLVTEDGDVWARPVGVTVDRTGALIVTEDGHSTVWRVRYIGAASQPAKTQ